MHRIEAGLLIPGHGGPIRDGVVILDGSRIGYSGPAGVAHVTAVWTGGRQVKGPAA